MTLAEVNALDEAAFVARFGALFEHSPWVVERAATLRPFDDLLGGLMSAVYRASPEEQLALIRAHPELAGKAAIDRTLTDASAAEQASAGLDRLTPAEYARFHALNHAYSARFGFPFIICARQNKKDAILAAFPVRLQNSREQEIETALAEIEKIAALRLADAVSEE